MSQSKHCNDDDAKTADELLEEFGRELEMLRRDLARRLDETTLEWKKEQNETYEDE